MKIDIKPMAMIEMMRRDGIACKYSQLNNFLKTIRKKENFRGAISKPAFMSQSLPAKEPNFPGIEDETVSRKRKISQETQKNKKTV